MQEQQSQIMKKSRAIMSRDITIITAMLISDSKKLSSGEFVSTPSVGEVTGSVGVVKGVSTIVVSFETIMVTVLETELSSSSMG